MCSALQEGVKLSSKSKVLANECYQALVAQSNLDKGGKLLKPKKVQLHFSEKEPKLLSCQLVCVLQSEASN